MTWTAPRTWVSGETVTASIMNTHVRDNLNALADGAWGRDTTFVTNTSSINTPLSGAFGNVTNYNFVAASSATYAIDCLMFLENPSSSAPDWRSGWSWTGTGTMVSGQSGLDTSVTGPAYNGPNTAHAILSTGSSPSDEGTGIGTPAAVPVVARVAATFTCTATGTVQMRHAQATSDATFATAIRPGSRMRVERIL